MLASSDSKRDKNPEHHTKNMRYKTFFFLSTSYPMNDKRNFWRPNYRGTHREYVQNHLKIALLNVF